MNSELVVATAITKKFDAVRRLSKDGVEYWTARDIQPLLGYSASWENFAGVVDKAKMACESAGVDQSKHFHDVMKAITAGKGAIAERADCYLSRFGCYLVTLSGDGRKSEVAEAKGINYLTPFAHSAPCVAASSPSWYGQGHGRPAPYPQRRPADAGRGLGRTPLGLSLSSASFDLLSFALPVPSALLPVDRRDEDARKRVSHVEIPSISDSLVRSRRRF